MRRRKIFRKNNVEYIGKSIDLDDQQTAIVISSTPKYSFIWDTFFIYLRKNWKNCPYQIYFTSEGECKYLENKYTINIFQQDKDIGFLEGYRYVCEQIKHKYRYFILLQDDFIIEKTVDRHIINSYEKIMKENSNIGFIRTMPCPGPKGEQKKFGNIELGKIDKQENFSFSYQSSIWNIDYFLNFTVIPKNNPWSGEIFLANKMKSCKEKENWGFIRPFKESHAVYESPIPYRPTAIVGGKLTDWAKKLIIN